MRTLTWNMSGDDVATLQRALRAVGHPIADQAGYFGWQTRQAVMAWQHDHGQPADGVASEALQATLVSTQAPPSPSVPGASSPQGVSLHIGLNGVDPGHYGGWAGTLAGCENDARTMLSIARSEGYNAQIMLTRQATAANVLKAIADTAARLRAGDVFMLTYAGHGAQMPNLNPQEDEEADQRDETWVLYDRMLIDDELAVAFSAFAPGVNIVLLSDSCHSGTVFRGMPRQIPAAVLDKLMAQQASLYRALQADALSRPKLTLANGIALNACQDDQLSQEANGAGVFTTQVDKLWADRQFKGSYTDFHRKLLARMPPSQTPLLSLFGQATAALLQTTPFRRAMRVPSRMTPAAALEAA